MKYKAIKEIALKTALGYLEKDPEKNMPKLMNWVDKLAGTGPDSFESQRAAVRAVVEDPANNMHQLILNLFNDVDRDQLKTFFTNFILNANILGWPIEEEYRRKYNCNIPWVILLDPTSACNLHCTGCWAAEYGNKLNLSFEEIDSIITQGKEMGVYFYIYTGGEPLVRKEDLIKICRKHNDCVFLSFTNGTLIDEAFADQMLEVGNFVPAISIEGFEEKTRQENFSQKCLYDVAEALKRYVPGFENAYLSAISGFLGVRESRRVLGDYKVTMDDFMAARDFEDSIGRGAMPAGYHTADGVTMIVYNLEPGKSMTIPYRCMVAKGKENLLVAGRCASYEIEVANCIRCMPQCMAMGEAAGTAAALAVKHSVTARRIDVGELQKILKDNGGIL